MMIILTIGVIVRFAITVLLKGSVKFCSLLLSGAGGRGCRSCEYIGSSCNSVISGLLVEAAR